MKFKIPAMQQAMQFGRGLLFHGEAYAARPVLLIPAFVLGGVDLKPGEEVDFVFRLQDFPPNADVENVTGNIVISPPLNPELQAATVNVEEDGKAKQTYNLDVAASNPIYNLELRLEDGEVFWRFSGPLIDALKPLPNFANELNAYLDVVEPPQGGVDVLFKVKSNAPGRVQINIDTDALSYTELQTEVWENELDDTFRVDRNFDLSFGETRTIALTPIRLPDNRIAQLKNISFDVNGQTGDERLLSGVGVHTDRAFATLSSEYALAQQFEYDFPLSCTGISSLLNIQEEVELYVEIQSDTGGIPIAGAALAQTTLTATPSEDGSEQWLYAVLNNPVELTANTSYWIVVKGIRGTTQLGLQTQDQESLGKTLVNRSGQLWKPVGGLESDTQHALMRLVYLPDPDHQTSAIEIRIDNLDVKQLIEPSELGQSVTLNLENNRRVKNPVLEIRSRAQGQLSIANVVQRYVRENAA